MKNRVRVLTLVVAFVLASSVPAVRLHAQGLGLKGIEPRAGFVNVTDDIGSTFLLGIATDLGEIVPSLDLQGSVDFWTKSYDFGAFGAQSEWRLTDIAVQGGVRYDFPVEGTVAPFAFSDLGLHIARASGEVSYFNPWTSQTVTEDESNTELEFGIQFGAGTEVEVNSGMSFVARAGYSVNGAADYLFITGGLKFLRGR